MPFFDASTPTAVLAIFHLVHRWDHMEWIIRRRGNLLKNILILRLLREQSEVRRQVVLGYLISGLTSCFLNLDLVSFYLCTIHFFDGPACLEIVAVLNECVEVVLDADIFDEAELAEV